MKTKGPGEFSQYSKMSWSAQQFYKEAAICRAEAARSLNQVDRDGWSKLACEWAELTSKLRGVRFSGEASGGYVTAEHAAGWVEPRAQAALRRALADRPVTTVHDDWPGPKYE